MASDINTEKLKDASQGVDEANPERAVPQSSPKRAVRKSGRLIDRRIGPRRSLLTSRLTRNIFLSNMIGLLILVRSLATTMTTYIGDQATGFGSTAELDIMGARQVLRGANVPDTWRVRLHDRDGQAVVDTATLNDTISVSTLDPIIPKDAPPPEPPPLRERLEAWAADKTHKLPWRVRQRNALRRDLRADVRQGLLGETVKGPRYDDTDNLIVSVSVPVQRVQQVLGVVTVEANDVSVTVNAARKALMPIIGLARL